MLSVLAGPGASFGKFLTGFIARLIKDKADILADAIYLVKGSSNYFPTIPTTLTGA